LWIPRPPWRAFGPGGGPTRIRSDKTVRLGHGRPSIATIRELLPNADHDAENLEVERREIEDVEGVVPLPGALELLRALPLDRWAIVTSCTKRLAYVRIRAADFPSRNSLSRPTTSPAVNPIRSVRERRASAFFYAKRLHRRGRCAGRNPRGKAAGARVVALQTTERDELLLEAGASYIVRDCSAMLLETSAGRLSFELRNAQAAFVNRRSRLESVAARV